MSFHVLFSSSDLLLAYEENIWAGSLCLRRRKHIWGYPRGVPRPIGLTDVLWLFHSRTDVAKMCLSPGTGDSAWQATGPIICDRGDTLAQGPNSTFLGPPGGPGTPSGGPQGASGPLPGLRADPGGVKNYPPRVTVGI